MSEVAIIEGTREEVVAQLQHFSEEQRFRLIALSLPDGQDEGKEPTLAERFVGRIGRFSFAPADLSERTEEYYNPSCYLMLGQALKVPVCKNQASSRRETSPSEGRLPFQGRDFQSLPV